MKPSDEQNMRTALRKFFVAIMKDDEDKLDDCIKNEMFELYDPWNVDKNFFEEFLQTKGESYNVFEIMNAHDGIDYLVKKRIISSKTSNELKALMDSRKEDEEDYYDTYPDDFPPYLRKHLNMSSKRSLSDHLSALHSTFDPGMKIYQLGPTCRMVRYLLQMNDEKAMQLLLHSTDKKPSGVELLADIIFHYGDSLNKDLYAGENIPIDQLFKAAMHLFKELNKLTAHERVLISANYENYLALQELKSQNQKLCTKIENIEKKQDEMMKLLTNYFNPRNETENNTPIKKFQMFGKSKG